MKRIQALVFAGLVGALAGRLQAAIPVQYFPGDEAGFDAALLTNGYSTTTFDFLTYGGGTPNTGFDFGGINFSTPATFTKSGQFLSANGIIHMVMPAETHAFGGFFADTSFGNPGQFVVNTTSGQVTFNELTGSFPVTPTDKFFGFVTASDVSINYIDFSINLPDPAISGGFVGGIAPVPETSHVLLAVFGAAAAIGFARRRFFVAA